jgi:hypothetical protein
MLVTAQQIQTGVINYVEQEIAQKAVGVKKFTVYFIMPQLSTKVLTLINAAQADDMLKVFFSDNGNIDLDALYQAAKTAITKSGQIEYAGIIFNETDIDKLYTYIKNTTV